MLDTTLHCTFWQLLLSLSSQLHNTPMATLALCLDAAQKELGSEAKLGFNCVGGSAATAVMKLLGLVLKSRIQHFTFSFCFVELLGF